MAKSLNDRINLSLSQIETVEITKLRDVFQMLSDQPYDNNSMRNRSPYFYRGLSNASYALQHTLQRNCGEKSELLESVILRNFSKYAIDNDPLIMESIWRQMVIGQHHGLPTRLLDWTYSPLVALHFAVNDNDPGNIENNDCSVWKIHFEDVNNTLPVKYIEELKKNNAYLFTVDMLMECAKDLKEYDSDMQASNSITILEPPSIDHRIVNQRSYFTVIPSHIDCLEEFIASRMPRTTRYIISKDLRWRIRDMLDQMNINERTLLPGFDGLASWIKRYYFVKQC